MSIFSTVSYGALKKHIIMDSGLTSGGRGAQNNWEKEQKIGKEEKREGEKKWKKKREGGKKKEGRERGKKKVIHTFSTPTIRT